MPKMGGRNVHEKMRTNGMQTEAKLSNCEEELYKKRVTDATNSTV